LGYRKLAKGINITSSRLKVRGKGPRKARKKNGGDKGNGKRLSKAPERLMGERG